MSKDFLTICANCGEKHDNHDPTFTLSNPYKGKNPIYLCDECLLEEQNISKRNEKTHLRALEKGIKSPVFEVQIFDRMTDGWNIK